MLLNRHQIDKFHKFLGITAVLSPGFVRFGTEDKLAVSSPQHVSEGESYFQQPAFIFMLARITETMESKSVVSVLELLAALFAGQGAAAGSEQPPAFVAGDVAR